MIVKKTPLIILLIILVSVALIAMFIYFQLNGTPWGKYMMKMKVEKYLKQKYVQEMIVKKIGYSFKNSTLFNFKYYAIVYLKDNPDLWFTVSKQDDSGKMRDNFLKSYWKYEVDSELRPFVKEVFGEKATGFIEFRFRSLINEDEYYINGEILGYHEVKGQLKQNDGGEFEIVIIASRFFDEDNVHDEYERMFTVLEFIKEKKYEPDKIEVSFRGTGYNKEFDKWRVYEIPGDELALITKEEDIRNYKRK